jgi:hypothetical protein
MGTMLPKGFKEAMVAAGKWESFKRRREDLRLGGMKPCEARVTAIREIAPEFASRVNTKRGRPRKDAGKAADLGVSADVSKGVNVECTEKGQKRVSTAFEAIGRVSVGGEAKSDSSVDFEALAELEKKTCSDAEAYRWAFIHAQLKCGVMAEAPSAFAWSLYKLFLESPSAKVDLSRAVLAKSVAKSSDMDEGKVEQMDGDAEYRILESLMEDRR